MKSGGKCVQIHVMSDRAGVRVIPAAAGLLKSLSLRLNDP